MKPFSWSREYGLAAILLLCLLLPACATAPAEVKIPVITKAIPPVELADPYQPEKLPEFVSPDDPRATSALTAEGERLLKELLLDMKTRIRAWEAWATDKDTRTEAGE